MPNNSSSSELKLPLLSNKNLERSQSAGPSVQNDQEATSSSAPEVSASKSRKSLLRFFSEKFGYSDSKFKQDSFSIDGALITPSKNEKITGKIKDLSKNKKLLHDNAGVIEDPNKEKQNPTEITQDTFLIDGGEVTISKNEQIKRKDEGEIEIIREKLYNIEKIQQNQNKTETPKEDTEVTKNATGYFYGGYEILGTSPCRNFKNTASKNLMPLRYRILSKSEIEDRRKASQKVSGKEGTLPPEEVSGREGTLPKKEISSREDTLPPEEVSSREGTLPKKKVSSGKGYVRPNEELPYWDELKKIFREQSNEILKRERNNKQNNPEEESTYSFIGNDCIQGPGTEKQDQPGTTRELGKFSSRINKTQKNQQNIR